MNLGSEKNSPLNLSTIRMRAKHKIGHETYRGSYRQQDACSNDARLGNEPNSGVMYFFHYFSGSSGATGASFYFRQMDTAHRLLDAVAAMAEPVQLAYLWRPALPDVDDDMVLEAAVNGRADGIVTYFVRAAKQFGVEVMRSGEAAKRLEQKR